MNQRLDGKGKFVAFAVIAIMMIFFCGHLAAVIQEGAVLDNWSELFLRHVLCAPLDFFYVNYYVLYFAICSYALIIFMVFSKRELPKAEMKGIEHGSNDFQTVEERNAFLAKNTTPIYSLDLHEFESEKLKINKQPKEGKFLKHVHQQIVTQIKGKMTKGYRIEKRIQ